MCGSGRVPRPRRPKRELQAAAASLPVPEASPAARADAASARLGLEVPLETKLYPPSLRKEWVPRRGLVDYLSDTTAKLILVDAPAGFGKTTLVAQWRASAVEKRPFAWISLDRGDNDPVRLWWHVVSALQRACPDLGGGRTLWQRGTDGPDLVGTLRVLVNELAALDTPVVLVLDDYHVIRDRSCHEQLGFMLLHLPPSVQVVLITRADPPLPLARLRATGDLAEIRMCELRFTAAETAALVYAVAGIQLSDPEAADLVARTEGWPAGMYLAALSLRGSPSPGSFIREFTGNNRFIVDFLAEEVLNRQSPEVRRFLLSTSILERFTAPLCDAVAGTSNAVDVIDHLEQANLFLVPLDDQRRWYRYHHLFAQMLRSQLARTEPDLIPALHRRACSWHRLSGSAEEAIGHAIAVDDFPGAVELIASHWYAFADAGRVTMVREWIRSLGDDRISKDPVAAHTAAWVAALCGDRDAVQRWLEVVEAAEHEGPLPDRIVSLRSSAALLRATFGFDGIRMMRESAAEAIEMESDPTSPWYSQARAVFGFSLYLSGMPGAAAALDQALLAGASLQLMRMLALAVAALVAADEGRLAQAIEFAGAAREIADSGDLKETPQGSVVYSAFGAIHFQQGKLEQARSEFEHALRSRRRLFGLSPWPTVDTLLRLARVVLDMGDRAPAAALLAEARDILASLPDGAGALQARVNGLERHLAAESLGTPLAEPLTEREEAVLRLLRGTLSLREIGRELYLSANTIKTHTRAIYRKLGVNTRGDAVDRARECGILF